MTRIVLVGAGHAHLEVARQAPRFEAAGAQLTLVDPGAFWYSGMATGMLAGMYDPKEDRLDARALIEARGGRFVKGKVASVNRHDRTVRLEDGRTLDYDLLSFNVGSEIRTDLGRETHVWPVKPIAGLCRLRERIEQWSAERPLRLLVVGGGPTGSEIAACLRALCEQNGLAAEVSLVAAGASLLESSPAGAGRRLKRELDRRGIRVYLGERVTGHGDGRATTDRGTSLPFDELVLATGLQAKALVTELGLPSDRKRGLRVNHCLQSAADERIFAAGDCADIEGENLPRLGVFGVMAAPVLVDNLIAAAGRQPLSSYDPQSRYLAILNMGDGHGLALWDRFWWFGKSAMWLKHRIDTRFLDAYRQCYQENGPSP
ncbi:MAG: FAD-dependent oxidoreductase [Gammaproteobacteria bacterium]|nr:FAD-dependent oxidoreductase [Gammaproteobacteria bacterium]